MIRRWLNSLLSRSSGPTPAQTTGQREQGIDISDLIANARAALEAEDPERAVPLLEAAIERRHDDPGLHVMLGTVHERAGRLEDANDCYLVASCHPPVSAEVYFRLGVVASKQHRGEDAVEMFREAVSITPDYVKAWSHLGEVLTGLCRFDEAEDALRRAVEAAPKSASAWSSLSSLLFEHRSDFARALECADRAIELQSDLVGARSVRAMILQALGRSEESLAECNRTLEAYPDHGEIHVTRSLARLMLGDIEGGWTDYEWRRNTFQCFAFRPFKHADWRGEPLDGKTILIYAEQGLGDEIMFASCIGDVIPRAGHCVIDCHPKLEKLFRRSFPEATIHGGSQVDTDLSWLERIPSADLKIPSGSLPFHFRRSLDAFPRHTGYLRADEARVQHWRSRLAVLGDGLKVGLSWRGGSRFTHRGLRSLELDQLQVLLGVQGIDFVSVQYGDCAAEIDRLQQEKGISIAHWPEAIDDYDETAALVSALDLVISVQTAVVHLGGALGKPVWVMVPAAPEWRYGRSGSTIPWYPSVTLFRQRVLHDWQPVISEVTEHLRSRVAC